MRLLHDGERQGAAGDVIDPRLLREHLPGLLLRCVGIPITLGLLRRDCLWSNACRRSTPLTRTLNRA